MPLGPAYKPVKREWVKGSVEGVISKMNPKCITWTVKSTPQGTHTDSGLFCITRES